MSTVTSSYSCTGSLCYWTRYSQASIYKCNNCSISAVDSSCIEGDVEIIQDSGGATRIVGYVQYCQDGEWKRVCQNERGYSGEWTTKEIKVACRQLGYTGE